MPGSVQADFRQPAAIDPDAVTSMRLHASCAAFQQRGVLILGASGRGKSSLALELMAYGAELVADDQVQLELRDGWPVARAPKTICGQIEARGIGILAADPMAVSRIHLIVDLDQIESARLPKSRRATLLGQEIPVLHKVETPHFSFGILQYLKAGRVEI